MHLWLNLRNVLSLVGFFLLMSESQSFAKNAKEKTASPQEVKQIAVPNISVFNDHIQRSGITTCAKVVEVLGGQIGDTDYGVLSKWNQGQPNNHIFNSLVGVNYNNKGGLKTGASVIVAAPQNASSCEGMIISVVPSTLSCAAIEKKLEKTGGGKKANSLATVPVFDGKGGEQMLLLPSGSSCVIVSTLQAFGS